MVRIGVLTLGLPPPPLTTPRWPNRSHTSLSRTSSPGILEKSLKDINKPDNDGVLPLHILSTFSTDLTRRLLDAGADATPTTNEGLNVFHLW